MNARRVLGTIAKNVEAFVGGGAHNVIYPHLVNQYFREECRTRCVSTGQPAMLDPVCMECASGHTVPSILGSLKCVFAYSYRQLAHHDCTHACCMHGQLAHHVLMHAQVLTILKPPFSMLLIPPLP